MATIGNYDTRLGGKWARDLHQPRAPWPENATTDAVCLLRQAVDFNRHPGPTLGEAIALNAALHLEGRHPEESAAKAFWEGIQ